VPTPLPIITNGFRVAHEYHSAAASFVNVFWTLASVTSTAFQVGTDWNTAWDAGGAGGILHAFSADMTYDGCTVTPLDGVSPSTIVNRASPSHGAGGSPMAPANVSLIVTWRSGTRGRAYRGRTYFAGVPNAAINAGGATWNASTISLITGQVTTWLAALAATPSSQELLCVSQHAASSPHHSLMQTWLVRPYLGTQRRRTEREE
jgi:hypothetical protein